MRVRRPQMFTSRPNSNVDYLNVLRNTKNKTIKITGRANISALTTLWLRPPVYPPMPLALPNPDVDAASAIIKAMTPIRTVTTMDAKSDFSMLGI